LPASPSTSESGRADAAAARFDVKLEVELQRRVEARLEAILCITRTPLAFRHNDLGG
jgi:hypothetical protein